MCKRFIDNVENSEKQEHLNKRRQAASHWINAFLNVKFLLFFLKSLRIIGIAFFELFELRVKKLHSCGIFLGFVVYRKKQYLCNNRKNYYRNSVIAANIAYKFHKVSERNTDNIIKCVQISSLLIVVVFFFVIVIVIIMLAANGEIIYFFRL